MGTWDLRLDTEGGFLEPSSKESGSLCVTSRNAGQTTVACSLSSQGVLSKSKILGGTQTAGLRMTSFCYDVGELRGELDSVTSVTCGNIGSVIHHFAKSRRTC